MIMNSYATFMTFEFKNEFMCMKNIVKSYFEIMGTKLNCNQSSKWPLQLTVTGQAEGMPGPEQHPTRN